jgi:TRAP-type mannitol/chloroaromatic compound transport system substrate-binding protein
MDAVLTGDGSEMESQDGGWFRKEVTDEGRRWF